jgi:hypothetical protein
MGNQKGCFIPEWLEREQGVYSHLGRWQHGGHVCAALDGDEGFRA